MLKKELGITCGGNTIYKKLRVAGILNLRNLPYQQFITHFKVIRAKRGRLETSMTLVRPRVIKLIRNVLLNEDLC